jgi:multiple sugar transport system permease protein
MATATYRPTTPDQATRFGGLMANTLTGMARRRVLLGYLFLIPTLVGIFIFTAGPVVVSFVLSFTRYDLMPMSSPEFVGLENYQYVLSNRQAMTSIGNTIKFAVFAITTQIGLALFLALALQRRMHVLARYFYRTVFFLPVLLSGTAVAVAFGYLFHREFGVVNYYLSFLGVQRIPWLNSQDWVIVTLVITYVWRHFGFTFIVFLGGLSAISKEVLEAADVDGATGWRRLRYITLPLLSPTILFATVTGIIGAIQIFEEPYIMTKGGPGDASRTAVMVLYEQGFKNLDLGFGATMAVFLFVVILVITAVQFWISKRLVFYQ